MHVFSFCIYGTQEFYYRGLKENLLLIQEHFPEWHVFIYMGIDARKDLIEPMKSNPNTHWIPTGCAGSINMLWRFFAIDSPDVESMHVRDADSRCHIRDRWCIQQFMNSDHLAYTIRDNPEHMIRMMGGLWGCRKLSYSVFSLFLKSQTALYSKARDCGYDQDFLTRFLWDTVKHSFASYGYKRLEENEYYTPIDSTLPERPFCGMME